jgi:Phosphodiester glycosidase
MRLRIRLPLLIGIALVALGVVACDRWRSAPIAAMPDPAPPDSISFIQVNNAGLPTLDGPNYAVLVNPRSPALDFKVTVGLSHEIYRKDAAGNVKRDYVGKTFAELVQDDNAQLQGQRPLAAINADYIDPANRPQGLNISRGWEYSGEFKNLRSSLAISGGPPATRRATIQKGRRPVAVDNYNVVGGNGRFYQNGQFIDICSALGQYACEEATERSLAAITQKGYIIFLVHHHVDDAHKLLPAAFQPLLQTIADRHHLGDIQDGILFDGGISPGLFYQGKFWVENRGPIGSVLLIYKR